MIRIAAGVVCGIALVVVLLAICVRPAIPRTDHELAVKAVAAIHAGDDPESEDPKRLHAEICEYEREFWVYRRFGAEVATDAGRWVFNRLADLNCD